MALINCPECSKSISSEALSCPSCGYPIKPSPVREKKTGLWGGLGYLLAVLTVVPIIVIVLLAAIAIPSFMRARTTSQANACINNLRQIEAAKDQYALENRLTNGAPITFANIGPGATGGGYIKAWPVCPASAHADTKTQSLTEHDYDIGVIGCANDQILAYGRG